MTDDLHVVLDVIVGTLLAQGLRLAIMEGIIKPTAARVGREGWTHLTNWWATK